MRVEHTFGPVWNADSRILILGSIPSVKSREQGFYYGHPRNRFWKVLAAVTGEKEPETVTEKKTFLLGHGIALWDVIASCEIEGSSDSSIRGVTPNDIGVLLAQSTIGRIYTNSAKAGELYRRYVEPSTGRKAVNLPSTSPANAAWSLERLTEAWKVIGQELQFPGL